MNKVMHCIALLFIGSLVPVHAQPPPHLLHYQGRLTQNGNLVNGAVSMTFRLFTNEVGGVHLFESTATVTAVDGLYSTAIGENVTQGSLGGALANEAVWLQVSVNGSPLLPRERLLTAPYAHMADRLGALRVVDNGEDGPNLIGGSPFNAIQTGLVAVTVWGGYSRFDSSVIGQSRAETNEYVNGMDPKGGNLVLSDEGTIGGGVRNIISFRSTNAVIAGGSFNRVDSNSPSAVIAGGKFNTAIGEGAALAGGKQNVASGAFASMGGGQENRSSGDHSYVGGGFRNLVFDEFSSIVGGEQNEIAGPLSFVGGGSSNRVAGEAGGSVVGGGVNNLVRGSVAVVAGGSQNIIQSNASHGVIGGGSLNVIADSATASVIAGGVGNVVHTNAFHSSIAGGAGNGVGVDSSGSVIGGGSGNAVRAGAPNATISGGKENIIDSNAVESVIGGGFENVIGRSANNAVIDGGRFNHIAAGASDAVVGGGFFNRIGSNATFAVLAGGSQNGIGPGSAHASLGGGNANLIGTNAPFSVIPGGELNEVGSGATNAFAGGRRAKARHPGAFVWADNQNVDFASTAPNQFLVRASGGVGIGTPTTPANGLAVAGNVIAAGFVGDGSGLTNLAGFATGTPVYVESDPVWNAEKSGFATGTPLYAFTEVDPVWTAASNSYYLKTQADARFATGTPLYAFAEVDPLWASASNSVQTGISTRLASNVWAAANSTTNFTRRTGDTMSGALALPSGGLTVGVSQLVVSASGNLASTGTVTALAFVGDGSQLTGMGGGQLAAGSITGDKIAAGAVDSAAIAANAIQSTHLASNSVTNRHIATNSITGDKIVDGTISNADIAASAGITGNKLASGTVSNSQLAAGAVAGANIVAGAITAPLLATGSVTAIAIADGAISAAALASNAVTTAALADGAVTLAKILQDGVQPTLGSPFRIPNPSPSTDGEFGLVIAMLGQDRVVIGARLNDAGATDAGAVHVHDLAGTALFAITNPLPAVDDQFGFALATLGTNRILVGAPYDDAGPLTNAGAAFLFDATGTLVATITNPAPGIDDLFGYSVAAIPSNRFIITSPLNDALATDAGRAWMYDANGSLLGAIATPSPAADEALAIATGLGTNGFAVAALWRDLGTFTNAGVVHLFNAGGTLVTTITNPAPATNAAFGATLGAVGSDLLLVAAPLDDAGAPAAGRVYLYDRSGTLLRAVSNATPTPNAVFGGSIVGLGDNLFAVGNMAGVALVFDTAGERVMTITSPGVDDRFASVVGGDSNVFFIAAPGDDDPALNSGAVYRYDFGFRRFVNGLGATFLPDDSVTAQMLAPGSVTAPALADRAVTTDAIADAAVTLSKLPHRSQLLVSSVTILTNPTPALDDAFGGVAATIDGSTRFLVGVPGDGATDAGAAHLYDNSGSFVLSFASPAPASGGRFGAAVAGTAAPLFIIGAPGETDGGAVHLFNDFGFYNSTITNPLAPDASAYGSALAISPFILFVGAPDSLATGHGAAGAVHAHDLSGVFQFTVTNPAPSAADRFGATLAVLAGGDHLLVGAPDDDEGAVDNGCVYLYRTLDGLLLATITNPVPAAGAEFGAALAVMGDGSFAVGAPGGTSAGQPGSGAAYLFDSNGVLRATLAPTFPTAGERFGAAVARAGLDGLAVGASGAVNFGPDSGSVYFFDFRGVEVGQTFDPESAESNRFGALLLPLGSGQLLVGVPGDARAATNSGVARIYAADVSTFAAGLVAERVRSGAISNAMLAADAVTDDKIASGAVGSDEIADGGVSTVDIADGSVTAAKIANGAISNVHVAANAAITGNKLALGTISNAQLAAGSITAVKLATSLSTNLAFLSGVTQTFSGPVVFTSSSNVFAGTFTGTLAGSGANITNIDVKNLQGDVFSWGGLQLVATNAVGTNPLSVAANDFNGDGRSDLAVANFTPGSVSVLTNNGAGRFFLRTTLLAAAGTRHVASGDVNGDGRADLVAASTLGIGDLTIFTNRGNALFSTAQNISLASGNQPVHSSLADFDGDGDLDIVCARPVTSRLLILTNNGFGVFGSNTTLVAGTDPNFVLAVNLNGQSAPDIVAANNGSMTLSVYTNNGAGGFTLQSTPVVGSGPLSIGAGDFNGDGRTDLAVALENDNAVAILTNSGAGTFGIRQTIAVGFQPSGIAVTDLDLDGDLDVVCANRGSDNVSMLSNNGQALFTMILSAAGDGARAVAVADFDGDGRPDAATADENANAASILLNRPMFTGKLVGDGAGLVGITGVSITDGTITAADLADNVGVWFRSNTNISYSAGSVGIGVTNPASPLHVASGILNAPAPSVGTLLTLERSGANFISMLASTNSEQGILFGDNVDSVEGAITFNAAGNTNGLQFRTANNNTRMTIDSSGRVGIGTTTPTNLLHVAGTVQALAYITGSDRNAKENIQPVEPDAILEKVAALPIATWTFKDEPNGTHIGPMAQDFHAAFGFGNTDTGIMTVDADGVALAAIQALARENAELKARLEALERRLEAVDGTFKGPASNIQH